MSESSENTSTPTDVDTSASAPVDTGTSVTNEAPAQEAAPAAAEKPDYSYVPAKFLNSDGTPDYKRLANSYTQLEKKKPNVGASSIEEYAYDFGEGFDYDEARGSAFREAALAKGLSADQYKFVMDTYKQSVEANTWTADKVETQLKEAWGSDYATNIQAARRGFRTYAPSNMSPSDPRVNDPFFMEFLASVGRELREDSVAGKSGGTSKAQNLTQEQVMEIMRSEAYRKGDRELHQQVSAFYQRKK